MFVRFFICLLLTLIGGLKPIWAAEADISDNGNICWKKEYNPVSNKKYKSQTPYEADLKSWQSKKPSEPNLLNLAKAYSTFQDEKQNAEKLLRDKIKHCYLGCRIANDTDYATADYVAWLKEYKDLTDCELGTRYEPRDYTATLDGAKHPGKNFDECSKYCKDSWKKRKRK